MIRLYQPGDEIGINALYEKVFGKNGHLQNGNGNSRPFQRARQSSFQKKMATSMATPLS